MDLLAFFREIALSCVIAILLPLTTYWGVNLLHENPSYEDFVTKIDESTLTEKEIAAQQEKDQDAWQAARKKFTQILFAVAMIVGFLCIVIGSMIKMYSLAIGLLGGGVLTICMGLIFSPGYALVNFVGLLFLLMIIIFMIVKNNQTRVS